jgi:aminopeptidase N
MRVAALLAALILGAAAPVSAQTATPGPGIPLDVATRRAEIISRLRYDIALTIPAEPKAPITGRITSRFQLSDRSQPLVVDFATDKDHVRSVKANGADASWEFRDGHVVVAAAALKDGENTLEIAFTAGDASLNRNPDFLYALFVPARAHDALPLFDQPDLKARWTLALDVPAQWVAVSNGAEIQRTTVNDRVIVRFDETPPLSCYLFSFVAGNFKVETAQRNGRTFRMFHRETDAAKVARNRDEIFDLHAKALVWLEQYAMFPYAWGKFDFVLIPAFQFGGMEHAGKILYNATGLLLDESATQNQKLGRASVIAHETAHMWFGDLVTMRWFNDVWMKEVFANFMAAKIVNPSFPEVNHDLRFLYAHYPAAYEVDRTAGANPIRQPLDNLKEAGSLYGAIIYQKAPVVMRHLERRLGEESFRDGLRDYLKRYAFSNATWSDLIAILDERTPDDLKAWSDVWVETSGRPVITTELAVEDGTIKRLAFRQWDFWGRKTLVWPQRLRVTLGLPAGPRTLDVALDGPRVEVPDAVGLPAPAYVLPNGEGWGYGTFALDKASLQYLSTSIGEIADPLTRGAAWVTLWDSMLEQGVTPSAFVDQALASLPREADEQSTARILGYFTSAWWKYLTPSQRTERAAKAEAILRAGLDAAATTSQKAAWFGTLRRTALTPSTVAWLSDVWAKKVEIPSLPLAETDLSALAFDLAVREAPGWSGVLDGQLARIDNPDRKARFEFIMPALNADPAIRERWFLALKDVSNRRREPWVLDGLEYLHHPLRARASTRYVQPSLEMLWEIQKTGDIFFPKRWMDATLGGHSEGEVAEIVETFLGTLPASYPPRLRAIVLASADELFRAANLR